MKVLNENDFLMILNNSRSWLLNRYTLSFQVKEFCKIFKTGLDRSWNRYCRTGLSWNKNSKRTRLDMSCKWNGGGTRLDMSCNWNSRRTRLDMSWNWNSRRTRLDMSWNWNSTSYFIFYSTTKHETYDLYDFVLFGSAKELNISWKEVGRFL